MLKSPHRPKPNCDGYTISGRSRRFEWLSKKLIWRWVADRWQTAITPVRRHRSWTKINIINTRVTSGRTVKWWRRRAIRPGNKPGSSIGIIDKRRRRGRRRVRARSSPVTKRWTTPCSRRHLLYDAVFEVLYLKQNGLQNQNQNQTLKSTPMVNWNSEIKDWRLEIEGMRKNQSMREKRKKELSEIAHGHGYVNNKKGSILFLKFLICFGKFSEN